MRLLVIIAAVLVVLSAGAAVLNVHQRTHSAVSNESKGLFYWSGVVSVHIKYVKVDPSLDTLGDPDVYFVVFINDQKFVSPETSDDEFLVNWWANATLTTRDDVVWIEISAWDDDSGLYGRDDLIDLDPGYGFSLDLIYNLRTHSWGGDVTGNNASGNRECDWGKIWFEITSTPDLEDSGDRSVSLPYEGYGRLDSSKVVIGGSTKAQFYDGSDTYKFYLYNGDSVDIYMQPSPLGDYAIYLYDPDNFLVASSNNAGYGGMEEIHVTVNTPGEYKLIVATVKGYGEYYLNINNPLHRVVNAQSVNVDEKGAYILSKDWSNINVRVMDYHITLTLSNPTGTSGYVRINFVNLDPDYLVSNFESNAHRGNYSLSILVPLNASETKNVKLDPWYDPQGNFWVFAMGDNRPGSGVYDHPYLQGPEFTLFTYYYTHVIKTPVGFDNGDLVAGFGGALVTEWGNTSVDALDYVYDMQYNRFYMHTGLYDVFFFTTIGNHDVSRHPYKECSSTLVPSFPYEGEHVYEEYLGKLYYSVNFSNTHIVFPDTYQEGYWHHDNWTYGEGEIPWWYARNPGANNSTAHYGGYIYAKQLQWLQSDLAASQNYENRIVVMHIPIIVPPGRDDNFNDAFLNYSNRVQVMQIFKDYKVNYMVVAHLHNYTFYYTNLDVVNGTLNVTSTTTPHGIYSIPTLMTGGAGAHNAYEGWGVPDIEGSYHFVLMHVNNSTITYHVYKYENLTDSNGNPLTTVTYMGANNGESTSEYGLIKNDAIYKFPYIRMKFYMSNEADDYVAFSETYGTYNKVYEHRFKDYTVVYVETFVSNNSENKIHVYSPTVPEFPAFTVPMIIILGAIVAVGLKRKE